MQKAAKYFSLLSMIIAGQTFSQTVLDNPYVKENTPKRTSINYTPLREADVTWEKRVWRIIDLREKTNQPFYYPEMPRGGRKALFDVLKEGIFAGRLNTFSSLSDDFGVPLTFSEAKNVLTKTEEKLIERLDGSGIYDTTKTTTEIGSNEIIQYMVKEDWFFDKQRSVMDVRIMGICPMKEERTEEGEFKGYKPLFWIYFPEARQLFANAEVFNRRNDQERRTYEDVFWKRMFSSFIYKESNVYDRAIPEYKGPGFTADGLLESDKIKDEMVNWEHDLWHF